MAEVNMESAMQFIEKMPVGQLVKFIKKLEDKLGVKASDYRFIALCAAQSSIINYYAAFNPKGIIAAVITDNAIPFVILFFVTLVHIMYR